MRLTPWHYLSLTSNIFPAQFLDKVKSFGMQDLTPSTSLLVELGLPDVADGFKNISAFEERAKRFLDSHGDLDFVVWGESQYPNCFRHLYYAPSVLFFRGDIGLFGNEQRVSIVGARQPTDLGFLWMERNISKLVESGIVTVSGGALGIDAEVHFWTLESEGKTISFLPAGLDQTYPRSHAPLFRRIEEEGGLLITEFPLETELRKFNFHKRNRLIATAGRLLIVVEAALKSGTIMTARKALEENREVLVVPGPPLVRSYEGSLQLLFEGASLARDWTDVIQALTGCSRTINLCEHFDSKAPSQ